MHYSYDALLGAAAELEQYSGYLDGEELKQSQQAQAAFTSIRNRFVYDALATGDDAEEVKGRVTQDLETLVAEHPDWEGPALVVRDELLMRIDEESGKNPTWRKVVRYAPIALGVALVVAYFGTKFYNDIDMSPPPNTPEAYVARAQALEKTLRYDDWASTRTRRGGAVKSILLWPISPSDAEVLGAQEIAGFAFEAEGFLKEQGLPCSFTSMGTDEELSDGELAYLEGFAERLQSESLEWDDEPQYTMLTEAADQLGCPALGGEMPENADAEAPDSPGQS